MLGGVLDVRRLLARIGVDDSRRRNFQIQNFLYLTLRNTQTVLIAAQSADIYDLHIPTSCCSTHTNTICLTARCRRLLGWASTRKVKTNLDFTEARDSEWQWHQLGHMQVCTSLQTDSHASTIPLSFLQAGCPSCHPTNSVKALKAQHYY